MSEPSRLNERERADLVAYLDGELKGAAARSLESRITHEPTVRAEADTLRRAWDLLDFLPLPEPSPEFTHRTLDKVTPVAVPASTLLQPRRRKISVLLSAGWAAAVGVALALGYGATRVSAPREPGEQDLVRDLRVIENKRLYDPIEDFDFVRDLDAPELFGDDSHGA